MPQSICQSAERAVARDVGFDAAGRAGLVQAGDIGGRCFVDSAPVLDKAWAKKSGLGWVGKNSNLITPGTGSFYFIAELIVDVELEYDGAIRDYCGTCTKCLDACPTQAITEPYVVDGSKCISQHLSWWNSKIILKRF